MGQIRLCCGGVGRVEEIEEGIEEGMEEDRRLQLSNSSFSIGEVPGSPREVGWRDLFRQENEKRKLVPRFSNVGKWGPRGGGGGARPFSGESSASPTTSYFAVATETEFSRVSRGSRTSVGATQMKRCLFLFSFHCWKDFTFWGWTLEREGSSASLPRRRSLARTSQRAGRQLVNN